MDLAAAVEFDAAAAADANVRKVRPGTEILKVSAKTGQGMDRWLHFLSVAQAARNAPGQSSRTIDLSTARPFA